MVQLATVLILYTGGNTSFNGFPFLANFVAGDHYLPRQLTRRGHRLAFSNGILVLAVVSIVLVLVFKAQVDGLVSLYAIGVFTGFTMAGAGMVKHHLTQKGPHWRRSVVVNGFSAFLSAVVVLIFAVAKFKEGAWVIVVVGPAALLRPASACTTSTRRSRRCSRRARSRPRRRPILRRHVVVVLVDRLDMATARAMQYARTLTPDDLRAVHFDIDSKEARELEEEWGRLGLARLPLDIIECPDRRLGRAAIELVADATLDGDTECTVLLPRRGYARVWQRFLHDRTADKIAAVLSQVPHVAATIIPYNLPGRFGEKVRRYGRSVQRARLSSSGRRRRRRHLGRASAAGRRRGAQRASTGRRPPGGPAQGQRGGRRPTTRWPAGPASPRRSPTSPSASGSRWPDGSSRCGSSRGPAPPTSSAC